MRCPGLLGLTLLVFRRESNAGVRSNLRYFREKYKEELGGQRPFVGFLNLIVISLEKVEQLRSTRGKVIEMKKVRAQAISYL